MFKTLDLQRITFVPENEIINDSDFPSNPTKTLDDSFWKRAEFFTCTNTFSQSNIISSQNHQLQYKNNNTPLTGVLAF